jgi:hypothetical protein
MEKLRRHQQVAMVFAGQGVDFEVPCGKRKPRGQERPQFFCR